MEDSIPQKRCNRCKNFKPATKEFFNSNKNHPDGLEVRCRDCRKLDRPRKTPALEPAPDGHKRCRQCGEAKPATKEYFFGDKNRPYGLTDYCKTCLQVRYRKHPPKPPVPDGYRRCTMCNEIKPATDEHFYLEVETGRCKPCYLKAGSQSYRRNREKVLARQRIYRKINKDRIDQYHRIYRIINQEKIRQAAKLHAATHKEEKRIAARKRRALKIGNGGTHTKQDIEKQYAAQKGKCYYCHKKVGKKYHVDHIVPLSRGGTNDPSNLVIACPTCNDKKSNKLLHEWLDGGRLL